MTYAKSYAFSKNMQLPFPQFPAHCKIITEYKSERAMWFDSVPRVWNSTTSFELKTVLGVRDLIFEIFSPKKFRSLRPSTMLSFQATANVFTWTRTQDISQCFNLPLLSSWFQGISMPNFVQIGLSVLELEVSIRTHNLNLTFHDMELWVKSTTHASETV